MENRELHCSPRHLQQIVSVLLAWLSKSFTVKPDGFFSGSAVLSAVGSEPSESGW